MTRAARFARRRILKGAAAGVLVGRGLAARGARHTDRVFDVAVIGAGISGLTAARDLAKAGLDSFVVLEARDRVGGRTLNADLGDGYVSELGGQWIGSTQTAVIDLARELDVGLFLTYHSGETTFVTGTNVTRQSSTAIVDVAFSERIDAFAREVPLTKPWTHPRATELDAMTYREWLDSLRLPEDQLASIVLGTQLTFGALPEQLSLLWVLFYTHSAGSYAELEGVPGEGAQAFRVVGGTQRLSTEIAAVLGDNVRLDTPVSGVRDWQGSGPCEIETSKGIVRARRVIMALSPSQALPLRFDPALPHDRAELQRLWPAAEYAMKTAMVYPSPFWRNAGSNGQSFGFGDQVVHAMTWDNSPPDGKIGVIGSFVSSSYGLSLPTEARKAALIQEYARSFGDAARPLAYFEQQWFNETYTKGCVSPLGPNLLSRFGAALKPALGLIEWAGTETAEIWNGYLDGAVRAGHDAALRTLRLL